MTASAWWILGLVLLASEMTTGTFYLLILGVSALLTGCIAWFGISENMQWLVASVIAVIGSIAVNRYRAAHPQTKNPTQNLDIGQRVTLLSQHEGQLRVRYRGTEWQAQLDTPQELVPETLYIKAVQGNLLIVSVEQALS